MIDRYSRPEMAAIWTEKFKLRAWLEVELLACEAMEGIGMAPRGTAAQLRAALGGFPSEEDVSAVARIEETTRHDVIAFLTRLEQLAGPPVRYLHLGMTSSDMLDTSFAVTLRDASSILVKGVNGLLDALREKAAAHRRDLVVGRTHGVHAEPTSLGLIFAVWYSEMRRNLARIERAREIVSVGKLSGAVGTFANIPPEVESYVCGRLGLKPAGVSNQIVQRDRHAEFFAALAITGATEEKIALNVRHMQRTEVGEVEEPFGRGQKGSSAMPHKRNPILCENICGLARVLRANAAAAMENVALWHERDISHSSVERVIAPDSTILLDFMTARLSGVVSGLVVHPENMKRNLDLTGGLIYSEALLLKLIGKGLPRQEAHALVQAAAMDARARGVPLIDRVLEDPRILERLPGPEAREVFDPECHLKYVDFILERVFE